MLREQGLGRHIDEDFIAAATVEMREAMNMTAEEFEAAAEQLLMAENEGNFRWTWKIENQKVFKNYDFLNKLMLIMNNFMKNQNSEPGGLISKSLANDYIKLWSRTNFDIYWQLVLNYKSWETSLKFHISPYWSNYRYILYSLTRFIKDGNARFTTVH